MIQVRADQIIAVKQEGDEPTYLNGAHIVAVTAVPESGFHELARQGLGGYTAYTAVLLSTGTVFVLAVEPSAVVRAVRGYTDGILEDPS